MYSDGVALFHLVGEGTGRKELGAWADFRRGAPSIGRSQGDGVSSILFRRQEVPRRKVCALQMSQMVGECSRRGYRLSGIGVVGVESG